MSMSNLIGNLLFSLIGMAAFGYGKKQGQMQPMLIGAALMGFPYFVAGTEMLFIVGSLLTAALFAFRE